MSEHDGSYPMEVTPTFREPHCQQEIRYCPECQVLFTRAYDGKSVHMCGLCGRPGINVSLPGHINVNTITKRGVLEFLDKIKRVEEE